MITDPIFTKAKISTPTKARSLTIGFIFTKVRSVTESLFCIGYQYEIQNENLRSALYRFLRGSEVRDIPLIRRIGNF